MSGLVFLIATRTPQPRCTGCGVQPGEEHWSTCSVKRESWARAKAVR